MTKLTFEIAHSIWEYSPTTGLFLWKTNPPHRAGQIGRVAGNKHRKTGYWQLWYKRKPYTGGWVAWLMMTGSWPKELVDHIDGNRADNRFCNLREATPAKNNWNRRVSKRNKLGVKGVFLTSWGKYAATIYAEGEHKYLGYFSDLESARLAYASAVHHYHGEFARS
jgi:Demerecviridae HNH endonuclease